MQSLARTVRVRCCSRIKPLPLNRVLHRSVVSCVILSARQMSMHVCSHPQPISAQCSALGFWLCACGVRCCNARRMLPLRAARHGIPCSGVERHRLVLGVANGKMPAVLCAHPGPHLSQKSQGAGIHQLLPVSCLENSAVSLGGRVPSLQNRSRGPSRCGHGPEFDHIFRRCKS